MKTILLTGAAALALVTPALAGAAEAPADAVVLPADDAAADGGTIIVTGTRSRSVRTVADSPVPIDVIEPAELKATGRTGLKEVLGQIVPSLTMPALGGGGTSASVRPISIRGLSGDYLLVLVNGKRRHTTSLINNLSRISGGSTPVDIDLIPTNAVGRIEVLRDSRRPIWIGRDLGRDQHHPRRRARGWRVQLDRGPALREGRRAAPAADRLWHADRRWWLRPLRDRGQISRSRRQFGRAGAVHLPLHQRRARPARGQCRSSDRRRLWPVEPRQDHQRLAQRRAAGGRRAQALQLLDAQLSRHRRQARRRLRRADRLWRPRQCPGPDRAAAALSFGLPGAPAHPRMGRAGGAGPEGDGRRLGLRHLVELWPRPCPAGRGGYAQPVARAVEQDQLLYGQAGPDAVGQQCRSQPGLRHRPGRAAVGRDRRRASLGEVPEHRRGTRQLSRRRLCDPGRRHPFGQLYGGRSPSPGLVSFTGTSPADQSSISRNNLAAYVDLSTSIIKGWFVGVAGRFEHYDDSAGDTVSGKFSTRYEIAPGFALRGGVNTGFRAPSLAQTAFSTTQNTVTVIGNNRVSTISKFLPVNSVAALALGAKPLKPEKSLNFTGGFTFERGPVRLTVDAYQIRVDDRIVKTEFLGTASNGGTAIRNILVANGVTNVDSAQFFTNAIDTRTRGVDVVAEYTVRTAGFGSFRLNAAYSYNKTKILKVIDNPAQLAPLNVTLFGRQAQRDLVAALPRTKLVLSNDWSLDRFHALLRVTRYGSYVDRATSPAATGGSARNG
ncbi:TonB-dependent receptor plug domain-containing protein [Rhizorhabdus histidinilytica]